jgi:hypothetical protein
MENALVTEADILEDIVGINSSDMSPETARQLLKIKLKPDAARTVRKLLRQNNRGTITAEDRILLEKYLHVGRLINLLQAKAHIALQKKPSER